MKRYIFNIVAVASMVLSLFIIGLSVRSFYYVESFQLFREDRPHRVITSLTIASYEGCVAFHFVPEDHSMFQMVYSGTIIVEGSFWEYQRYEIDEISPINAVKLIWRHGNLNGDAYYRLQIADIYLIILFGIPPALWMRKYRRARRQARMGCCARCGYDLRASPERCPECGEATQRISV